jgi:hypothetical protein
MIALMLCACGEDAVEKTPPPETLAEAAAQPTDQTQSCAVAWEKMPWSVEIIQAGTNAQPACLYVLDSSEEKRKSDGPNAGDLCPVTMLSVSALELDGKVAILCAGSAQLRDEVAARLVMRFASDHAPTVTPLSEASSELSVTLHSDGELRDLAIQTVGDTLLFDRMPLTIKEIGSGETSYLPTFATFATFTPCGLPTCAQEATTCETSAPRPTITQLSGYLQRNIELDQPHLYLWSSAQMCGEAASIKRGALYEVTLCMVRTQDICTSKRYSRLNSIGVEEPASGSSARAFVCNSRRFIAGVDQNNEFTNDAESPEELRGSDLMRTWMESDPACE